MLRICCKATLPMLYKAHEPATKTGIKTINSLISIFTDPLLCRKLDCQEVYIYGTSLILYCTNSVDK